MCLHIRAHFDGKNLVPDQPLDLPVNQPLDLEITRASTTQSDRPSAADIAERLRKLDNLNGLIPGPVVPLDALRRENMYDDRA